jgi:hypothetical protein
MAAEETSRMWLSRHVPNEDLAESGAPRRAEQA